MRPRVASCQLTTGILGSVVDQQQLPVPIALSEHPGDGFVEERRGVSKRDDNLHEWAVFVRDAGSRAARARLDELCLNASRTNRRVGRHGLDEAKASSS